MKKSSRTAMNYVIACIVVVFVFAMFAQPVGATQKVSAPKQEDFTVSPHVVEEATNETEHTIHVNYIDGRMMICCSVNPAYYRHNQNNARSFEPVE